MIPSSGNNGKNETKAPLMCRITFDSVAENQKSTLKQDIFSSNLYLQKGQEKIQYGTSNISRKLIFSNEHRRTVLKSFFILKGFQVGTFQQC